MPIPFPTFNYKLITQAWKLAKVEQWLHQVPGFKKWRQRWPDNQSTNNDDEKTAAKA
ncbi:MAG: hypothetical protein V2J07_04100 [Anaerolineae bacterium]|jgi:hypothetical protein|nr:hypothetical protein [Anaerolineae bacterium]